MDKGNATDIIGQEEINGKQREKHPVWCTS
jgi:hypothetical protein